MNNVAPPTPRPASPDQLAGILRHATAAAEAVRGIVHDTLSRDAIPAQELYRILELVEDLADGLDQALRQLAGSLVHSLAVWDEREYNSDTRPSVSVAQACDQLDDAATYAYRAGRRLAATRAVLAGQASIGQPSQPAEATSSATRSSGAGAGR